MIGFWTIVGAILFAYVVINLPAYLDDYARFKRELDEAERDAVGQKWAEEQAERRRKENPEWQRNIDDAQSR